MAQPDFSSTSSFDPTFLNQNEQDLLMTALNSNMPREGAGINGRSSAPQAKAHSSITITDSNSADLYTSPLDQTPGSGSYDQTPFLDYDLDEANLDWDVDGQLIGELPEYSNGHADLGEDEDGTGEKRKNPTDDDGSDKRRSSEDKTNKKPGRKPLTSEPTSVSTGDSNLCIIANLHRNVRRKIARRSVLSGSAKNAI